MYSVLQSFDIFLSPIASLRWHLIFFFCIFYILLANQTALKTCQFIKPLKDSTMLPQMAGHGTSALQSV
jgi:hypothetical protein